MAFERPARTLRIGDVVLDPRTNTLHRGGEAQRLPVRIADLLLRLAVAPGELIRREQLIDDVWERRMVSDEVLSRAIADLRQALGDDARAPRYIETLPKLGYRLIAAVRVDADGQGEGSPGFPASDALPESPQSLPGAAMTGSQSAEGALDAPTSASGEAIPRFARRRAIWTVASLLLLSIAAAAAWQLTHYRPSPADPLTAENLLRARPFTTEPGRELLPRFTPDSRWVIYTRVGDEPGPATLRLRAVDGTEDRVLIDDDADNLCGVVSPDGHRLAWLRLRPGVCEVVVRPLLGGAARVLAACDAAGSAGCPDWSHDGKFLLLGAGGTGQAGLREVDVDTGAERVLTRPSPGPARDLMPRYERDGDAVVFWRGDAWSRLLLRLDRNTGVETPLQAASVLGFGHASGADGALLVADDSTGRRALVRHDRDGNTTLLGAWDARHPDIAADGSLVFEITHYDANLWRVDLLDAAAAPRRLTASARYDSAPAFSPDGTWLAFGSNRDGREAIFVMRADGSDERKLALDPQLRWSTPEWSPDGTRLLLLRYDADGARLCLHTLATAALDCPATWPPGAHAGIFLGPDAIAFVAQEQDGHLWRASLDGAPPQRLSDIPMERCRAAGEWLACFARERSGVIVQPLAGGESRVLLPELGADARGDWTLAPDALYAARRSPDPAVAGVYRIALHDGAQRRVGTLLPGVVGSSLSVSPDQSVLVLARTDRVESDLMLVPPPAVD